VRPKTGFVIPLSLVGRDENVSIEHARRLAKKLSDEGLIEVQRTPTGRMLLDVSGYELLRQSIQASAWVGM
jgi:DNA-binding IscR family transcriptional regulator